jgi:alkyl hydroperoxide reductase subunit AhpF
MPEKILNQDIENQILELFKTQLVHPVEIILFTQSKERVSCDATKELLAELSSLSVKISLTVYDIGENAQLASKYNINRTPGIIVASRHLDEVIDFGVHFSGLPSGYEFSSLIQAIILVSKRDSGLKQETRQTLLTLRKPVNLKVFATPT